MCEYYTFDGGTTADSIQELEESTLQAQTEWTLI